MKYYEIKAKTGHVGRNNFYVATFYVYGINGREAAEFVRKLPRVKHHDKQAILSVKEISQRDYKAGKEKTRRDPFFFCHSIQEQRILCSDLNDRVFQEEKEEVKNRKRHSLRNSYNENDPLFLEYKSFKGDLDSFALAV